MSTTVSINNNSYSIPIANDENWGTYLHNTIEACAEALQRNGGTFTLTSDLNFGTSKGVISPYFKSFSTSPATSGIVQLNATDSINWGATANYQLNVVSDTLTYNGASVITSIGSITGSRAVQTSAGGAFETSDVTATELGYIDGVTSSIQDQLDTNDAAISAANTAWDAAITATNAAVDASNTAWQAADTAINANISMILTDWVSWTPDGAWSTNCTYTGYYRRVNDTMEAQVKIALAGPPDASVLTVNIPSGQTVDTTKLVDASNVVDATGGMPLGTVLMLDSGAGTHVGEVTYESTTAVRPMRNQVSGDSIIRNNIEEDEPITFTENDCVILCFSLPISGW